MSMGLSTIELTYEHASGNTIDCAFRREGEYWTLAYAGAVLRLKHCKGLGCIAQLLAQPGVDVHVADLRDANPEPTAAPSMIGFGDAGPLLDAKAKQAYRARLHELKDNLEDAEIFGDQRRVGCARYEMEFLSRELARAIGLGGRDRRASSGAERVRVATTKVIKSAIAKIARYHPAFGRYLSRTIRTGHFCSYTPDVDGPLVKILL